MRQEPRQMVYLYTHWGGSDIAEMLQKAMAKRHRWDDESYLTRIIVCQMIGEDTDGETGFGISTHQTDNQHLLLVVDCNKQAIWTAREESPLTPITQWTFEEFIVADLTDWEKGGTDE